MICDRLAHYRPFLDSWIPGFLMNSFILLLQIALVINCNFR